VFHFIAVGALFIGSIGHAMLPGLARAIREGRQRSFWLQLAAAAGLVILLSLAGAVLASLIGSALVEAIYGLCLIHICR
ncbi:hypothetical protein J8J27_35030, partial [Mycobacterium tuberculosis]|nr:hypothetical protein [Mycobacterium tuberculosis]